MKRLSFFLAISAFSLCAFGQGGTGSYVNSEYYSNFITKPPTASANLGSFGNLPINYYTGSPEVSFPLMTLASRELTLPISIAYDASGIRTDELSGPIGMKWNLNAGGSITRGLNGLPDELPIEGYLVRALQTDYYQYSNIDDVALWIHEIQKNKRDSGPDDFYVNISGRSIRFVFDKYGNAVTIPRQNVKISKIQSAGNISEFTVTLEDGVKYVFGGVSNAIEQRKIESVNIQYRYDWDKEFMCNTVTATKWTVGAWFLSSEYQKTESAINFYNSRWYLVSITSPAGDKIDLSYYKRSGYVKYVTKANIQSFSMALGWGKFHDPDCIGNPELYLTAVLKLEPSIPGTPPPNQPPKPNLPDDPSNPLPVFNPIEQIHPYPGSKMANHSLITENDIVLTQITAANGNRIDFSSTWVEDVPYRTKYGTVYMYDMNNNRVKAINFNYSVVEAPEDQSDFFSFSEAHTMSKLTTFRQTDAVYYPHFAKTYSASEISDAVLGKYVFEGLKAYNFKRVYLESIDDVTTHERYFEFEYNSRELLRRRTTPVFSEFGFHSSLLSNPAIHFTLNSLKKARIQGSTVIGKNEHANPLLGMLTKIKYPTGASTTFTYVPRTTSSSQPYGPVLFSVHDTDENSNEVYRRELEYGLNEMIVRRLPVFVSYLEHKLIGTEDWLKYITTTTIPQNHITFTHGAISGYREVKVYYGTKAGNHNGWETFIFSSPVIVTGQPIAVSGEEIGAINFTTGEYKHSNVRNLSTEIVSHPLENGGVTPDEIFPFPKPFERDYLRGLLLSHKVHSKEGKLLKETTNHYRLNPYGYTPLTISGLDGGTFHWTSEANNKNHTYGRETNPVERIRFSRPYVKNEWVVLERTREIVYNTNDTDTSKNFNKYTYFNYDPTHLQLVETKTFSRHNSDKKIISKTKFVTHPDYTNATSTTTCQEQLDACLAGCNDIQDPQQKNTCIGNCYNTYHLSCNSTAIQQAIAIKELRNKHQVSTPVEIQSLTEESGQTRILSAIAYKYLKQGSPLVFVKPEEILGLKQIVDPTAYTNSTIAANGTFTIDGRLRSLHKFTYYDQSTSNLISQTTQDGIVTDYLWGFNNSAVTEYTINPGGQQQKFFYDHYPAVGLKSTTDQNGRSASFVYDKFNRLKLVKDHDGNIVSRTKYHTLDRGFNSQITHTNTPYVGSPITFTSQDDKVDYGTTTILWNFGNGSTATTQAPTSSFTSAGTYTVTVTKSNLEYATKTVSKQVTIYNPPSISLCVDGPDRIDLCGGIGPYYGSCTQSGNHTPSSQSWIKATFSGGCPTGNVTYTWEFQKNSEPWVPYSETGQTILAPSGFLYRTEGTYTIRCRATDACGNETISTISLSIFKTTSC